MWCKAVLIAVAAGIAGCAPTRPRPAAGATSPTTSKAAVEWWADRRWTGLRSRSEAEDRRAEKVPNLVGKVVGTLAGAVADSYVDEALNSPDPKGSNASKDHPKGKASEEKPRKRQAKAHEKEKEGDRDAR